MAARTLGRVVAGILSGDDAHWQPYQRLRAVRLLGKQTVDAVERPGGAADLPLLLRPGPERARGLRRPGRHPVECRLRILPPAAGGPSGVGVGAAGPGVGADGLLALVEGVIADLDARAARHAATAEREAASAPARLAFDDSPEGRRLRQIPQRLLGSLLRTIALLMKVRCHPEAPGPRPETDRNHALSPDDSSGCEKIRNEPTADPIRVGEAFQPDPGPIRSDVRLESPTCTKSDRIPATSPDEPSACEKMRNEPTAGPADVMARPTPHNAGLAGDPAAGRGPPSGMPGPPRSRGIRLGPMSGLASTSVRRVESSPCSFGVGEPERRTQGPARPRTVSTAMELPTLESLREEQRALRAELARLRRRLRLQMALEFALDAAAVLVATAAVLVLLDWWFRLGLAGAARSCSC